MGYIAVVIAPCIAICMYFFYRNIYNKEPSVNLLVSFMLGCLSVLTAMFFQDTLKMVESTIDGTVGSVAILSYFVIAMSEEGGKFLGLRYYSFKQLSFDEPFDGIVYAVMISMGFATVENIKYVTMLAQPDAEYQLGVLRMFTAAPAHATFAIVMGYFAGKAKFDSKNRFRLLLAGFFSAMFFHGTYNFFLLLAKYSHWGLEKTSQYIAIGAFVSFIVSLILCRKLIRQHRDLSQQMFKPGKTTSRA